MAINYDAKTDWKPEDTFYNDSANKWEQGIKDCADGINEADKTKRDMEYDAASGESEVVPKDSELKEGVDFLYRYANNISAEVGSVNETLDDVVYGNNAGWKNLLVTTIQNQTKDGIKIEKNSDGTITLNGTCTGTFNIVISSQNLKKGQYKLIGCDTNTDSKKYLLLEVKSNTYDTGNGGIFNQTIDGNIDLRLFVYKDAVLNNVIIKPMITEDTRATYTDYVPNNIKSIVQINASLDAQGLLNIFDAQWLQGSNNVPTDPNLIHFKHKISVNVGDVITIKFKKTMNCDVHWFSGTSWVDYASFNGKKEYTVTVPSGINAFWVDSVGDGNPISPSTAPDTFVYINNAIDEIKADLTELNNDLDIKSLQLLNGNIALNKSGKMVTLANNNTNITKNDLIELNIPSGYRPLSSLMIFFYPYIDGQYKAGYTIMISGSGVVTLQGLGGGPVSDDFTHCKIQNACWVTNQ